MNLSFFSFLDFAWTCKHKSLQVYEQGIVKEVEVGQIYTGKIVKILDFGAIAEIGPKKSGMIHISQIADHHVDKIEDELSMGQEVTVRVREIDSMRRINLTMKLDDRNNSSRPERRPRRDNQKPRGGSDRRDFQKRR